MIITDKKSLAYFIEKDRQALGISRRRPKLIGDNVYKFQLTLRYTEYYTNGGGRLNFIFKKFWQFILNHYSMKLGFSIPVNTFGPGLRINHYGLIVVNPDARIGAFCDIHQGVNIGQNIEPGSVPEIGSNVWIGPGVKIFGKIKIADGIAIAANSVVNKSFTEPNITIGGVPARKLKDGGDPYHRK